MKKYKDIKIGVEYFPGDSGGYYKLYSERIGEQDEMIITWDEMEVIKEAIENNEI